jgi:hypothetical protein
VLPPGREEWGSAIRAEAEHIQELPEAIVFSVGCIGAALNERVRHVPTLTLTGLWSVALLTAGLALFELGCAARGAAIALGAPDPYLEALLKGSPAERASGIAYRAATPAMAVCLLTLGLAQVLGAFYLIQRKWRRFVLSSWAALACSLILGCIIIWIGVGAPAIAIHLAALLLQAVAVPLLWQLSPPVPLPSSASG